MKAKKLNANYTTVCHYCGVIFKHNKSSGRFCPDSGHRQLYGKYGPRIDPNVRNDDGQYYDASHLLHNIYEDSQSRIVLPPDGWSIGYPRDYLLEHFQYKGPYPTGSEILVVADFVVQKQIDWEENNEETLYEVKPITLLTDEERMTALIVSAKDLEEKDESVTTSKEKENDTAFVEDLTKAMEKMKVNGQPYRLKEETE